MNHTLKNKWIITHDKYFDVPITAISQNSSVLLKNRRNFRSKLKEWKMDTENLNQNDLPKLMWLFFLAFLTRNDFWRNWFSHLTFEVSAIIIICGVILFTAQIFDWNFDCGFLMSKSISPQISNKISRINFQIQSKMPLS